MEQHPMYALAQIGQSVWLDYISRQLMDSGRLQSLIDQGLRGMTSNPTIFHKSISSSADYDADIRKAKNQGLDVMDIYDRLTIADIQRAADFFRPVYEGTDKLDGYVSLEINPHLAQKLDESVAEGIRLFRAVNRPNVMIKVPSTDAGFAVVEELLSNGVNVNVTLIFSLAQYASTAQAYLRGLKRAIANGHDLAGLASVASVFVSRVDTAVDARLEKIKDTHKQAASLRGRAAVANARLIHEEFERIIRGEEFKNLARKGARPQRVLWASTGTKNPDYSDIKYVAELICAQTVNTLPENTLRAFIDHGSVKEAEIRDYDNARQVLDQLNSLGIDLSSICAQLLDKGLEAFEQSFDDLLEAIEAKSRELCVSS